MMTICCNDAANISQGVRRSVNHIIGMQRAPFHPKYLIRLPVFPNLQAGSYTLESQGVYEVISEYYRIQRTEEDYFEIPTKRVYTYYTYDGMNNLQELAPDEVT